MRRVVLFKEEATEWRAALQQRGLEPTFVDALQYDWLNQEELRAALQQPHDALVVTSARAAQAAAAAAGGAGRSHAAVYAVGEATARCVQQLLGCAARGASAGSAAALGPLVARECGVGARVLWPRGARAEGALQTALEAAGVRVHAVVAYEARAHHSLAARLQALHELQPHALALFSAAGAALVLRALPPPLRALPVFALGQSTARGVRAEGLPVAATAPQPAPHALADAIHTYFQTQTTLAPPGGGAALVPNNDGRHDHVDSLYIDS